MKQVAVVGSGPAALMAAEVISRAGIPLTLFEKRKSAGRKLLIAGSSGLNIGNSLPLAEFLCHYDGPQRFWNRIFAEFFTPQWLAFIESELGIGTFEGSSGRYFVEDMKAARMLAIWLERLRGRGVKTIFGEELTGFQSNATEVQLNFRSGTAWNGAAAIFALGGASYEPDETPLRWPALFQSHGFRFSEFSSSNSGFQIAWPSGFLKEAEGKPLKNITLNSPRGIRKGEAMITNYGIEGTPVYAVGQSGPAWLDLKPDLSLEQIRSRLLAIRENLSPIRRVKKLLKLCDASLALLFHCSSREDLADLDRLTSRIKRFPIEFGGRQPLTEAISSSGGLALTELNEKMMLTSAPGIFCAGEMLDWDTVTGGFLIQACVSQGYAAGIGALELLK